MLYLFWVSHQLFWSSGGSIRSLAFRWFVYEIFLDISGCLLKNFYIQPLLALKYELFSPSCSINCIALLLICLWVSLCLESIILITHLVSFFSIYGYPGFLPFVLNSYYSIFLSRSFSNYIINTSESCFDIWYFLYLFTFYLIFHLILSLRLSSLSTMRVTNWL